MRHLLLAQPVAAVALGMFEAAFPALLITATGGAQRRTASALGTAVGTVDLTPIVAAADDHLRPTAIAEEHSARRFHRRFPSRQRDIDREWQAVEDFPCTRAQHGVGTASG